MPFQFCIPDDQVQSSPRARGSRVGRRQVMAEVPKKTQNFHPVLPGAPSTYIYSKDDPVPATPRRGDPCMRSRRALRQTSESRYYTDMEVGSPCVLLRRWWHVSRQHVLRAP